MTAQLGARQLKQFVAGKQVKRLHDPLMPTSKVGRWRREADISSSLTELTLQAESAGKIVVLSKEADTLQGADTRTR